MDFFFVSRTGLDTVRCTRAMFTNTGIKYFAFKRARVHDVRRIYKRICGPENLQNRKTDGIRRCFEADTCKDKCVFGTKDL